MPRSITPPVAVAVAVAVAAVRRPPPGRPRPSACSGWRSAKSVRKCALASRKLSKGRDGREFFLLRYFELDRFEMERPLRVSEEGGTRQEACSGVIGTNDSHNPLSLSYPVPPSLDAVSLSVLPRGPFPLSSPLFVGGRRTCLGREGSESSSCSLTC